MSSKVKRLIDKDALIADIEKMKLPRTAGIGLNFDLVDQHNQTIRDVIGVIESAPVVTERDTLDDVLERLPERKGGEFLQYGTSVPNCSPKFFCGYSGEEGDTFTTHSCVWSDVSLKDAALKLEALINSSK